MNSYTIIVKTIHNLPPAAFLNIRRRTTRAAMSRSGRLFCNKFRRFPISQQINRLHFDAVFHLHFAHRRKSVVFFIKKLLKLNTNTHTHAETLKFLKAKQNSLWKNENKFRENAATNVGHLLKRARNTRDFCFFFLCWSLVEKAREWLKKPVLIKRN